jgi:phage/plasmid-like protein (TIGR03299 family)
MAHELNLQNGKASMMYVGEAPWHGLGTQLNKPATAAEAIKAANLDWSVCKHPIYLEGTSKPIKDKFAVVRADKLGDEDCPVFGIVGKSYTPLQNSKAFEFFDPIVGEKNAPIYHTAGALGDGERVWILAKLPDIIRVIGNDIADKYLLLSNSHDGQSSVQIKFTPIRVVCQNTLTMALSKGPTLRVPHTRDLHYRLQQTEIMLGIINKRFGEIGDTFKAMAKVEIDHSRLTSYLNNVFPEPSDKDNERAIARAHELRALAEHFFAEGMGNTTKGVKGTLWAAYNGVTELVDHRIPINQRGKDIKSARLNNVWFGEGYLTEDQGGKATLNTIHKKFGKHVADIVDGCTDAYAEPNAKKPKWEKRKAAYIAHLQDAPDSVRLVSAADKLHNARAILADYREYGDKVYKRFKKSKDETLWYYRRLANTFREVLPGHLSDELHRTVKTLEKESTSKDNLQAQNTRKSVYARLDVAVDKLLAKRG